MKIESYPLDPQLKKTKDELVEKLLKSKLILSFLEKYQLETDVVKKNSKMFYDYLLAYNTCSKCKDIADCDYKPRGYLKTLFFQDSLDNRLVACRFNQSVKTKHSDYFVNYDLSEEWLLNDFLNLDIGASGNIKKIIIEIEKNISAKTSKGIFLFGDMGVGKTHLMSCIANYFAKNKKTVGFYNVSTLSNRAKMYIEEPKKLVELMDNMITCDVLILDDVGASRVSEWIRDDWLYTILNNRLEHKRRTYITSNLDYAGLKKYFTIKDNDELKVIRLLERIEALTEPIQLIGDNRRRKANF